MFIFDCLLKSMLSNMKGLEVYLQRVFDVSVINNRLILSNDRILKVLYLFKKTNSTNVFSKFLEHTLRFQVGVQKNQEIKKDMYWILNNKVDGTSNQGVISLLDFIFSQRKVEDRDYYRRVKEEEEIKEKNLAKIQ